MTTRDVDSILQALSKMNERLGRIEERLDGSSTHEERIRKVEQRWAMLSGIVVFLAIELQAIGLILAAVRL